MTPNALVLEVLGDYENVDPLDADNAERVARLLNFLRHVYLYVENFREWEWTYTDNFISAVAPTDTVAPFPTRFLELGSNGAIYHPVTGRPIPEQSRHRMSRLRHKPGLSTGDPYQAFAQSGGQFHFTGPLGATALPIYHRVADEIQELDAEMLMPEKYIRITLLPALVWRIQNMKNDDRAVWAQTMQAGLAQMCVVENPRKGMSQKMPLANRKW